MQIIIPMTGDGLRFRSAGYERLKPLIRVHGVPMVEWVARLFPGSGANITFICCQDHLDSLDYLAPELRRIAPQSRILAITDWTKKGPVNDLIRVKDHFSDDEPAIVSYCDYFMLWDFASFRSAVAERGVDGAIPCYSGFHPHLLPPENVYASCRVDASDELLEIREKFSWTPDRTQTRHSPGLYYFRSGKLMKTYCERLLSSGEAINGEYYVSLVYNAMVQDGLRVWCPVNVPKFCQWGTPRDLAEYERWTGLMQQRRAGGER